MHFGQCYELKCIKQLTASADRISFAVILHSFAFDWFNGPASCDFSLRRGAVCSGIFQSLGGGVNIE